MPDGIKKPLAGILLRYGEKLPTLPRSVFSIRSGFLPAVSDLLKEGGQILRGFSAFSKSIAPNTSRGKYRTRGVLWERVALPPRPLAGGFPPPLSVLPCWKSGGLRPFPSALRILKAPPPIIPEKLPPSHRNGEKLLPISHGLPLPTGSRGPSRCRLRPPGISAVMFRPSRKKAAGETRPPRSMPPGSLSGASPVSDPEGSRKREADPRKDRKPFLPPIIPDAGSHFCPIHGEHSPRFQHGGPGPIPTGKGSRNRRGGAEKPEKR